MAPNGTLGYDVFILRTQTTGPIVDGRHSLR